ncbi:MAG: hypothetical protein GFH25_541324n18 [Chloroflexi bacterium AL-N10]|nr:hypothetical protein [Chloroflexi bacterium AL-N10]
MPPAKKRSLAAAMQQASGKQPEEPVLEAEEQPESTSVSPGRATTKMIGGHCDPAVSKQLRRLAVEHDTTVQGLLAEALNDLFAKYGEKPIA